MTNILPSQYWIAKLGLEGHVEGGAFREIYRSPVTLEPGALSPPLKGRRQLMTHIYFLLEENQFSGFHRIQGDELWHFYYGDRLLIYEIRPDGRLITHSLGQDPETGDQLHCCIQAGSWFASRPAIGSRYALVGCTVAPGFDFEDFELAARAALQAGFPSHARLIEELTRD